MSELRIEVMLAEAVVSSEQLHVPVSPPSFTGNIEWSKKVVVWLNSQVTVELNMVGCACCSS